MAIEMFWLEQRSVATGPTTPFPGVRFHSVGTEHPGCLPINPRASAIFKIIGGAIIASAMATYTYETIPQKKGQKPRRFEIEQKMSDAPLTHDPETGLPVRRVITGGSGLVTRGAGILSMNRPKRK